MKAEDIKAALSAPFPRKDIEFRIGRLSAKNRKANVLAYITARAIMDRLDSVFGIDRWKDEYEVMQNGVKCRLAVKIGEDWIGKEDVAPFTNIEALKGAFSDSLKRTGVKFGVGRYLYDLPEHWVEILAERPRDALLPVHYLNSDGLSGYWVEPQLPEWALPAKDSGIPVQYAQKLDDLFNRQLLTSAKYEQYKQMLSQPKLTEAQRALVWEQLSLIDQWAACIPQNAALTQEQKRELYLRIINSTGTGIEAVKAELLNFRSTEEAA